MWFDFQIAKRYLFGSKSVSAINIITAISTLGIAIGTAALILILSVFNGFEELISSLINSFNPDLKVAPIEGKLFTLEEDDIKRIEDLEGVLAVSRTLEEIALFEYRGSREVGVIKGVDQNFQKVTEVDSTLTHGKYFLGSSGAYNIIVGVGLANKLSLNIRDGLNPVSIYMPVKNKKSPFAKDFKTMYAFPAGFFSIESDNDFQYAIASREFVNKLIDEKNAISYLEIKTRENIETADLKESILEIIGDKFVVKDRYQQDEAFLKIMNIEKWMSFAIVTLTLFLIAFNLVGCLWMIVLDKKHDISTLKAMGATKEKVRNIFITEGILISGLGLLIGILISLLLFVLQKQFGLVSIPEGYIIDAYPIKLVYFDFIVVIITVLAIGFLASILPSIKASKIPAFIREE
jgi:lipoprotein-releasing system permease protein